MAIEKSKRVKAVIQFRRATEADWIKHDPVLRLGEPALSVDVNKIKVGTGKAHWSEIEYLSGSEATNYMELANLPSINEVTLIGEKSGADLGLQEHMDAILEADIDDILFG